MAKLATLITVVDFDKLGKMPDFVHETEELRQGTTHTRRRSFLTEEQFMRITRFILYTLEN